MGLVANFHFDNEAITVPYPPLFDSIRRNHGFVDLRGRPDLAVEISEGMQSIALRALLIELAGELSPIFSIGCDLGAHEEPEVVGARHVAGGYVQLMYSSYANKDPDEYQSLGEMLARKMEEHVGNSNWRIYFVLAPVAFKLDDFSDLTLSLRIWFYAAAQTAAAALISREALITRLRTLLKSVGDP